MKGAFYVILGTLLEVCRGQYIAINPKPSKLNPCDNQSSTTLIERFFDLIFTEFLNTPPACVCIQLCPEHPTYCYPNGCLKRSERKMVEDTTAMVNQTPKLYLEGTTKSIFLGVDHRDVVDDLLDKPVILTSYGEATDKPNINDLIHRPNPFKELVMKYKKLPRLEMKYNLREQVRSMKSDKLNKEKNIDISKTRWPSNKHLLHGKSPFQRIRTFKKNEDPAQTKFFVSMFPDYDPLSYSPIFYKKYLTKRENNDGVNLEAVYLYQTDTSNFTLETLIDNLIERGLDKSKNETRLSFNIEVDTLHHESTTETNINFTDLNFLLDEENNTNSIINNRAVSIISMNSTNENTDVNKYSHDTNFTNQDTFLEMIASMNKEIERQNKASFEFMERITGAKSISNEFTTADKIVQNNVTASNINVTESSIEQTNVTRILDTTEVTKNNSYDNFTSTKKSTELKKATTSHKKTQLRSVRKLKRRKLN